MYDMHKLSGARASSCHLVRLISHRTLSSAFVEKSIFQLRWQFRPPGCIKLDGRLTMSDLPNARRPRLLQGMVAIDGHDNPRATREFEADVVILHHSTTVAPGYQPVIHCGVVRQAAAILSMTGTESGVEMLRTGQTATVRFRFMVGLVLVIDWQEFP